MAARCPVCGRGRLFAGVLSFRDQCEACGADFSALEDTGDGPAVFVIFIVGIFIVPLPVLLSVVGGWPSWLSLTLFIPVIIGVSVGLLRWLRGVLFAQQWRRAAMEQRFGGRS
ncbi:MAG: DUF983 domain-containing protein [Pseudomonadota bacterium]